MFQDSVPAGSYNDPFLSSVCNICIDVKLLPFFLSSSFSLSNLDLYIYIFINNAERPGPSFPTWSNEAGI